MNTKLKCILLDDELTGLAYLKLLCEQIPELEVVKAFNNPDAFLSQLPQLDFDLCILDIEMPERNGLQVAGMLNGKPVIFTTAYKDYAAEAFDLNAIDYVRKPIRKDRLEQAISKAQMYLSAVKPARQFVQLNTDKGKAIIFFDQLYYIRTSEVDSRDKIAQLADGTLLTIKNYSFEKIRELLPASDFVRVNKKEMIAIKAIQFLQSAEITTQLIDSSGHPIVIALSEIYREEFNKKVRP